MNTDIEKLREIYVAEDVDEETRTDNLAIIREWEKELRSHEDMERWREHPITLKLAAQARKSYVDHSLLLARSRELNEAARFALWAKQDAAMWLLLLVAKDSNGELDALRSKIARALAEK